MRDHLSNLIKLQKIDSKIQVIEELCGDLPQKVENLEKNIQAHQDNVKTLTERIVIISSEINTISFDLQDLLERKKNLQDKLYKVTNNREYDSFTEEINFVDKKTNEMETSLLEKESEKEISEEKLKAVSIALEEHQKEFEIANADYSERKQETEGEKGALMVDREKIHGEIPDRILSKYHRIYDARNGLALAPIIVSGMKKQKGRSCGGCFQRVAPQDVIDVRGEQRIVSCSVCGRILYSERSHEQKNAGKNG